MGIVAVITKIMPESRETNLHVIEGAAKVLMEKEGAKNISFEEQEIAFGLKAIMMKMAWPEEKATEIIEAVVAKIPQVSSVTIVDYRRAFG
jgi:translation elongation factor aEF-1 beta